MSCFLPRLVDYLWPIGRLERAFLSLMFGRYEALLEFDRTNI